MTSLKQLAIKGTIWTIAGFGTSQILRFGCNLILTRLLFPKLFGLMALVNTFILGLHLFSDIGVGPSIIQNKRGDDPTFLNTAWTLQVIRGLIVWLCCLLSAWPVAQLYAEPQLLWLIPVVGLSTIITSFNSTAVFTLNRHLALGQLAIFELGGQFFATIAMIFWALFSPTIWSLVIGGLVADITRLLWSHRLISGFHNRFAWDRQAVGAIFAFGKWIFLSTAVTFLGTQADRLILGKLISFELLGVYGIAFALATMPQQLIGALASKVILPAISKLTHLSRPQLRVKVLQNRRPILMASALIVTVLASFGDMVILALYDRRYSQAAWMLPILSLGIWPNLLFETLRQSLVAIGKPNYETFGQFFKCLHICIGLPLGFSWMGIVGAVTVVALNDLPLYGIVAYGLWREGLTSIKQDVIATVIFFIFLTCMLAIRVSFGFGLPINQIFLSQ
jgi:O-antigen/teichoic acid export membrane protein